MKNIIKKLVLTIFVYLFVISCSSNTEPQQTKIEYPTILFPIGRVKADSIQNSIRTNEFFSFIDDYGLFSNSGSLNRGSSNITNKNVAIKFAKESLLKYSKYSNINDTSKLKLEESSNNNPYTDWVISFGNQQYDGLEVLNTNIYVIVHDQVKQIIGHHFKEISIPTKNLFPKESLEEKIVGQKLETSGKTNMEVTITSEMIFKDKIDKSIIWSEFNSSIELRVVWNIPIGYTYDIVRWNVYVDILSGEMLSYKTN
ncbi:MAG: hypothetical protein WAR79_10860 [Melioribacteraceae bacterium]